MQALTLLRLALAAVLVEALVARLMASRAPAPAPRFRGGVDGVDAEKALAKVATGSGSIHGTFLALMPAFTHPPEPSDKRCCTPPPSACARPLRCHPPAGAWRRGEWLPARAHQTHGVQTDFRSGPHHEVSLRLLGQRGGCMVAGPQMCRDSPNPPPSPSYRVLRVRRDTVLWIGRRHFHGACFLRFSS